jgi:hypothetical protein
VIPSGSRLEALLAMIVIFLAGTAIRVRTRESLLRGAFGAQFEDYASRALDSFPEMITFALLILREKRKNCNRRGDCRVSKAEGHI